MTEHPIISTVDAAALLTGPGWQQQGPHTLTLSDGRIESIGAPNRLLKGIEAGIEAEARLTGDIVLPALVNAHDHGRGLRTLSYGAPDGSLESWLPWLLAHPRVDPYLFAAVAFATMATAGIGTAAHCHTVQDPQRTAEEIGAVARAARDVGIRVSIAVPVMDRNRLGYGLGPDDETELLGRMAPSVAETVRQWWLSPPPSPSEYVELVCTLAAEHEDDLVEIQCGPVGTQWCSDELLGAIAEHSQDTGRRVHIHLLETEAQLAWANASLQRSTVVHLDHLGLLSPRLTVAHGVWLTDDDIELHVDRGVALSVNTSSNLRLRSGIAPVPALRDRGARLGLGLDGMALDDDQDLLREARLSRLVHSAGTQPPVTAAESMSWATHMAAPSVLRKATGTIDVGHPADLLLLDAANIDDRVTTGTYILDLVAARATRHHVRSLIVDGRAVVVDGQLRGIDLPRLVEELHVEASRPEPVGDALRTAAANLGPLVAAALHYPRAETGSAVGLL